MAVAVIGCSGRPAASERGRDLGGPQPADVGADMSMAAPTLDLAVAAAPEDLAAARATVDLAGTSASEAGTQMPTPIWVQQLIMSSEGYPLSPTAIAGSATRLYLLADLSIYFSDDGKHWTACPVTAGFTPGVPFGWIGAPLAVHGKDVVAGTIDHTVWMSSDGCQSFTEVVNDAEPILCASAGSVVAVSGTQVSISHDDGAHFTSKPVTGGFYGCALDDAGDIFLAAPDLRSLDDGASWKPLAFPTATIDYRSEGMWSSGATLFVVGGSGGNPRLGQYDNPPPFILRSRDRGASFDDVSSGIAGLADPQSDVSKCTLSAVWGSSSDDIYAAGDAVILHSRDGGGSWAREATDQPPRAALRQIWGRSADDVFAVGQYESNDETLGVLYHRELR
jgi:hypothetical protein